MINVNKYNELDKLSLRQKGWKIFAAVIALQMLFLLLSYMLHP
ncbi:KGW motif small protein [Acinetobacter shaoyimingii]|nr:KGW motif small protein [Acinetobacter shaoyimingii]